jgi:hypothetical protein
MIIINTELEYQAHLLNLAVQKEKKQKQREEYEKWHKFFQENPEALA